MASPSFHKLDYGPLGEATGIGFGLLLSLMSLLLLVYLVRRPKFEELERAVRVYACLLIGLVAVSGKWRIAVLANHMGARRFIGGCEDQRLVISTWKRSGIRSVKTGLN